MANQKDLPPDHDHWLVRPANIRLLWGVLIGALAVMVLAEFVWHPHPHFALDSAFGFGALYGLLCGVALIVVTKTFAVLVKRKDTYYD
ncbi:MAG: hypothetical protein H6878_10075 [Rhodobiaceae bacterium]|nr:hypothetical protein [Rhodobiaceae bacterium]MCC0016608.1 hypothetical protein [Rhodobiaceae bacterium]MCC0042259.1 hypothetical protein [Rhodobiaceae bacterium]